MPNDLIIAWPEYESALQEELSTVEFANISLQAFQVSSQSVEVLPAFARQFLPNAQILEGQSIKQSAQAILDLVPKEGSWRIHFCDAASLGDFEVTGRSKLIETALLELLKKKDRFGLKRMVDADQKSQSLIQHFSLTAGLSAVSVTDSFYPKGLVIEGGIGGRVFLEEDKRPPARAYRKLQEALLLTSLEIRRKETVVDLGSSPGSWTWVCLEIGAGVTAVDRAELDSALMENNSLKFVKGDAFTFKPEKPVDWLVSDIIAGPYRIIKLVEEWVKEKRMKKFCVTLKFKGEERRESIAQLRDVLKDTKYLIRHLENNKNEVTAIGLI